MTQTNHDLNIARAHFKKEVTKRAPWILLSVVAGVIMITIGQNFEAALSKKIELVFFIPMIVYMSDSIGTETLALFVRELALRRVSIKRLFLKETLVGLFLGLISGTPMGLYSFFWTKDAKLSIVVTIAMIINGLIAVLVGMFIPIFFAKIKKDPALGTDEITTALSDNLSILIYFVTATLILFNGTSF